MVEKDEIKCPYCGHDKYELFEGETTFDGPIYYRVCMKCKRKW